MTAQDINPENKVPERLIASLREGIAIVQMVFFKELKKSVQAEYPDHTFVSMLCGAVTNEIFGTVNTGEPFIEFGRKNRAAIEQYLFAIKDELAHMRKPLTDALRMQAICDQQQQANGDGDSTKALQVAEKLGILITEREMPLPSAFMTIARNLGEIHGLIIPPTPTSPEDGMAN
ncbi:MAG: hypothetical protein CSB24_02785 [Deltaproteobacteria bacterium]|nr:MAG: hypothetical protein CSB24_02785 [Deltaproteobacteria bacterium]